MGNEVNLEYLEKRIQADPRLVKLESMVREKMQGDPAHDFPHVQRVATWTIRLGKGQFEDASAIAAAYLHDWVNVPKNSPDRSRASELSAAEARVVLEGLGFQQDLIEDICAAIRTHSFSRGERPVSPLGECLQDADRLEAIGALGIYRCLITGVNMGASLVDWQDPWAEHRELDDRGYSVDHFFTKLLNLKDQFKTDAGRVEAEKRTRVLKDYLIALANESGWKLPPDFGDELG